MTGFLVSYQKENVVYKLRFIFWQTGAAGGCGVAFFGTEILLERYLFTYITSGEVRGMSLKR